MTKQNTKQNEPTFWALARAGALTIESWRKADRLSAGLLGMSGVRVRAVLAALYRSGPMQRTIERNGRFGALGLGIQLPTRHRLLRPIRDATSRATGVPCLPSDQGIIPPSLAAIVYIG